MADLSNVQDEKQYRVELNKVVKIDEHVVLTPGTDNVVKGKRLKTFPPEVVISAVEV